MASPSETIEPCENEEASSPLGHEEDQTNLPCEEVTFTTINDLSDDSYDSDSDEEFRNSNCDISSDVSDSEDAEELAELQKEILILEGESFLTETGTVYRNSSTCRFHCKPKANATRFPGKLFAFYGTNGGVSSGRTTRTKESNQRIKATG